MNLSEAIDQGVVNSTRVDATQNLAEHPDAKFSVSLSIRDICCSFDMIMYVYVNNGIARQSERSIYFSIFSYRVKRYIDRIPCHLNHHRTIS